ncbi:hypothetical protein WR25_01748 [Diploscapter pachys]|uniref:SH3 domain-containing protein n=1 Tax=Diploscapter pachys TaxID=2018661 RepID=A0A2A2LYY4_9BILA|nr:hypothetical protein WR25_01748 [Diploscapter pachys]
MGLRTFVLRLLTGKDFSHPHAQQPVTAPTQSATASAWVDSSQLQSIEPYSPCQLTKSFAATVADELSIVKGMKAKAIYREDDWIYVQTLDGRRGFVPQQYCKIKVHSGNNASKKEWRMVKTEGRRKRGDKAAGSATIKRGQTIAIAKRWEKTNLERFLESLPIQKEEGEPFPRIPQGQTTAIYAYTAKRIDDVSVESGDKVLVLNKDDPDWTFVRKDSDGSEGFVPAFILQTYNETEMIRHKIEVASQETTELLIIEDFASKSDVDLCVKQGDWVESTSTSVNGWLWVKHDKTEGFIPTKIAIMATDL